MGAPELKFLRIVGHYNTTDNIGKQIRQKINKFEVLGNLG
jgi:hypothetical protein